MKRLPALLLLLLPLLWPRPAPAEPYTPQRDEQVIERLPQRLGSAAERAAARQQRAELQREPASLALALPIARAAIARFRSSGDPRELGQAQAALAPWWAEASPPPPARLLRALIRQSQHEFAAALADFEPLLADPRAPAPLRAQAELSRAAVLQLLGRWREAGEGCARLAGPAYAGLGAGVGLHGRVCLAELDSLQGREAEAGAALARLAALPAAPRAWISLLRAELAERRGEVSADALFRQALAGQADIYTRAAYADWLLGRQRWSDAAALLLLPRDGERAAAGNGDGAGAGDTTALPDALLLRLCIAWLRGRDARAAAAVADLQARFEAAALRGDRSHGRELARFHLDVKPDAAQALREADLNWRQQKEPADALLLLRAAAAAARPAAAAPVRQFQRTMGLHDVRLEAP